MVRVSVVIATFNRRDLLARTLPCVFAQDFPRDEYEVVLVVDGSTDGTTEMLRTLHPKCPLTIIEQPNRGQAAAQNAGLRAAEGEVVLFLDDDVLCDPGLVSEHAKAHAGLEPMVAFGPVEVAPESPRSAATDWVTHLYRQYLDHLQAGGNVSWPADARIEANRSAPRSLLVEAGGFDEKLPGALFNVDLGIRLWERGARFHYLPAARARQIYVKSARHLIQTDARQFGIGEVRLASKHPCYRPYVGVGISVGLAPWKAHAVAAAARSRLSTVPMLSVLATAMHTIPVFRGVSLRMLSLAFYIQRMRGAVHEAGSWAAVRREFAMQLPVLTYHHVGKRRAGCNPWLTVSPQSFAAHVDWLARHGFTGIRPRQWVDWVKTGSRLPHKPVLITFDDAYADIAETALPVLQHHGFGGVVFVVSDQVGGTNAWDEKAGWGTHRIMTAEQIRLWASRGIEFGSHTRSHPDLQTLSRTEIEDELWQSRRALEEILGAPITSFAYPYGRYNDTARQAAAAAFESAFTTEPGLNKLGSDLDLLKRMMVLPNDWPVDVGLRARLGNSPLRRIRPYRGN
ncbi:MAG TPA: polysaccharide deacetylase family protein [Terriglobales bacterium]